MNEGERHCLLHLFKRAPGQSAYAMRRMRSFHQSNHAARVRASVVRLGERPVAKLESVLVVDDNERCIEFISLALEAGGKVHVHKETTSRRAVERVREENPGLVLLDVKMPDVDGFDVLKQIRTEGRTLPIIMFSGSARQADIDRAYALGCNGYVEKPGTLSDYRDVANAIINFWGRGELPAVQKAP
jgi:CheY-like chemotaxis protein